VTSNTYCDTQLGAIGFQDEVHPDVNNDNDDEFSSDEIYVNDTDVEYVNRVEIPQASNAAKTTRRGVYDDRHIYTDTKD